MARVWIINRKVLLGMTCTVIAMVAGWTLIQAEPTTAVLGGETEKRTIHMVTGEFSATTSEGTKIEAYRWDPGTLFINKGEEVELHIYGINGKSHPFVIEGLNVKGEVKQGEETVVSFTADKEGIYRMICLEHPDRANKGPMIAYLVVD